MIFGGASDFSKRSYEPEMMDGTGFSFDEYQGCLADIARLNRLVGTHKVTLAKVFELYLNHQSFSFRQTKGRKKGGDEGIEFTATNPMLVLDVGCGYGDFAFQLSEESRRRGCHIKVIGVDLHPWSVEIARKKFLSSKNSKSLSYEFKNVFDFSSETRFDVIVSSMVAHHFNESELEKFILWMNDKARLMWMIHDIHRHPIPYYSMKFLTRLMGLNRMVQNDAPLSVKRAFNKKDLKKLMSHLPRDEKARSFVEWKFPFKFLAGEKKISEHLEQLG